MKFADWLNESKKTQSEIAKDLRVSQAHISMVASGKKQPSADLIADIHRFSKGRVTMLDWYPDLAPASDPTPQEERVNG